MTMPWLLLVVAGLREIAWAVGLKASDGFTRPLASLYDEPVTVARIVCLVLLLVAIVRLKLAS
jgi:quaternary ammonium compound-resistance protein SugE